MNSDSLSLNPNLLKDENPSVFLNFIQKQDEAIGKNSIFFYTGDSKEIISSVIKQKMFVKDSAIITSMFYKKNSFSADFQSQIHINHNNDWTFITFLICLIFLAIFTFKNQKRISQLFKAFGMPHFTNQLVREGNIMREFFIYPLLLIYFVSQTLLFSNVLIHFFDFEIVLNQVFLIFIALIIYFICKIIFINLIGSVFQTKKETFEYLTNYIIFSVVFGLFLFPFVFILVYASSAISNLFLYIVLIIFMLINIYRSARALLIGLKSERYNLYYLILYLCTVEILPLSISFKLLINFNLTGNFLLFN
jgi:hypothetical protein